MNTVAVWLLFVFMSGQLPQPGIFSYATKAECEEMAKNYARAVCVKVDVPKR